MMSSYCQTPVQSDSTVQVSRTNRTNNPHQNLPEGSVLQTWYLALRLNSQNEDQVASAMDGNPPSVGWSPTLPSKGWLPTT